MKISSRSSSGFTLIELVVVITIIVFLAGMLLQRVWFYQEQAEKAAMEQVAGAVQSALVMQYGHLLTRGKEAEVKNLQAENPMRWLMQRPDNYVGEFFGLTPSTIPAGNWAFDLKSRELIYVPYRVDYFDPGNDGFRWVRYRVQLEYEDAPGTTRIKKKAAQELTGVLFKPVVPYKWIVKGEE